MGVGFWPGPTVPPRTREGWGNLFGSFDSKTRTWRELSSSGLGLSFEDRDRGADGTFHRFLVNKKPSRWVPGGLPIGSAGYARTTLAA